MPQECFGLIGGLGVGAAVHYYRELAKTGSVDLVMVHADMPRMIRWAEAGDARSMAEYVATLIARLQAAGATFAALPAVTPHLCIDELRPISPLPLIDMLDVVDRAVRATSYRRVALFGTRFTINTSMFNAIATAEVVRPQPDEVDRIHEIYFRLASTGAGSPADREALTDLAATLIRRDSVDAILLAGTDLALIFDESNTPFPHLDCARVHLDAIRARLRG